MRASSTSMHCWMAAVGRRDKSSVQEVVLRSMACAVLNMQEGSAVDQPKQSEGVPHSAEYCKAANSDSCCC